MSKEKANNMTNRIVMGLTLAVGATLLLSSTRLTAGLLIVAGAIFFFEVVKVSLKSDTMFTRLLTLSFALWGLHALVTLWQVRTGENGYRITLMFVYGTAMTDICAMLGGKYMGGKFFPNAKIKRIRKWSPSKTPEGFLFGAIAGFLTTAIFGFASKSLEPAEFWLWHLLIVSLLTPTFAIGGDLIASIIKRLNHVDDYGTILVSHGGVADRVDSHVMVWTFVGNYVWLLAMTF